MDQLHSFAGGYPIVQHFVEKTSLSPLHCFGAHVENLT